MLPDRQGLHLYNSLFLSFYLATYEGCHHVLLKSGFLMSADIFKT